jgi:hypothetical protein
LVKISNAMRTNRKVLEIIQDQDAETEMVTKGVKCIVNCFLEPNLEGGISALPVMGISVDQEWCYLCGTVS